MALELRVDTAVNAWVLAREIFVTVVLKFKIGVDRSSPYGKAFSVTPKSVEITNMKVMANDTEMEMEQMMVQSAANIHLENVK